MLGQSRGLWSSSWCSSAKPHCPGASHTPTTVMAEQWGEEMLPNTHVPWALLPTTYLNSSVAGVPLEAQ